MSQPAPDHDPAGPALSVAAVARRLGVAPATLRTWDRRYGIGPSSHNAGSHRRYAPADVRRLERMHRLTLDGVPPAEAARVAMTDPEEPREEPPSSADRHPPPGGGRAVPIPGAEPGVRGLARAAMSLDAPATTRLVRDHLEKYGAISTWDQLLVPVLVGIGERWQATGVGVEVEHLLSESVLAALHSARRAAGISPLGTNARPVLLAGAPEEQHTLPIHILSGALLERGVASRLLGARVPQEALADAVRRSGACSVFLWAHRPEVIGPDTFDRIPPTRPPTGVVVGGPGWLGDLPNDVRRVHSLAEAVEVLTRSALGGAAPNR